MKTCTRLYVSMPAAGYGTVIRRKEAPKSRQDLVPDGVYAVGPFRTYAAAQICASGLHSPIVQCVAQYEKLARKRKETQQ